MLNVVAKGWGHELWIVNNERYCGKQLTVLPDKWCSLHYHELKAETFYVLEGALWLEFAERTWLDRIKEVPAFFKTVKTTVYLEKGSSFDLDVGMAHRFTSCSLHLPCTFIEFSTHHDDSDSFRIFKGD